ncbi:MAG: hypothetical protein ABWZ17_02420 [Candidatus Binatia bacterium]
MVAADDRTRVKIPPLGVAGYSSRQTADPHYLVWGSAKIRFGRII